MREKNLSMVEWQVRVLDQPTTTTDSVLKKVLRCLLEPCGQADTINCVLFSSIFDKYNYCEKFCHNSVNSTLKHFDYDPLSTLETVLRQLSPTDTKLTTDSTN